MNMFVCEQGGNCGRLLHGVHMGTAVKGNLKPKAGCAFCVCFCVCVYCLFQWKGELSFLMARERKDVSSLDSGVPLLFMKTKQKERGTRGEREKEIMREGGTEEGKSRKLEPVAENNAVCSLTET